MKQLQLTEAHPPLKHVDAPATEGKAGNQAVLQLGTRSLLVRVIPTGGRLRENTTRTLSRSHEYQVAGNEQVTPHTPQDTPYTWERNDRPPPNAGDQATAEDIVRHTTAHAGHDPRPLETAVFNQLDPDPPLWDFHAPRIMLDVSTPPPPAIRHEEPCGLLVALTMRPYTHLNAGKQHRNPTAVELWNGIIDTWKQETDENISRAIATGNYTLLTELEHGTPHV